LRVPFALAGLFLFHFVCQFIDLFVDWLLDRFLKIKKYGDLWPSKLQIFRVFIVKFTDQLVYVFSGI